MIENEVLEEISGKGQDIREERFPAPTANPMIREGRRRKGASPPLFCAIFLGDFCHASMMGSRIIRGASPYR